MQNLLSRFRPTPAQSQAPAPLPAPTPQRPSQAQAQAFLQPETRTSIRTSLVTSGLGGYSDEDIIQHVLTTKLLVDSSRKIYMQRIKTVQTEILPGIKLIDIVMEPEKFRDALLAWSNHRVKPLASSTLGSYPVPFLSLVNYSPELKEKYPDLLKRWKQVRSEIQSEYENRVMDNQPTDRQAQANMPFEEIVAIRDGLPSGSDDKLLLSMYTMIPPVRADWGSCQIIHGDSLPKDQSQIAPNWILIPDGEAPPQYHIADFKTAGTNPPIEGQIPDDLKEEIVASLEERPRDWLFTDKQGRPMSRPNFTAWANRALKRITGKPEFSLTLFRHIYVSRDDLDLDDRTLRQKSVLAKQMGHSVGQQARYEWRKVKVASPSGSPEST